MGYPARWFFYWMPATALLVCSGLIVAAGDLEMILWWLVFDYVVFMLHYASHLAKWYLDRKERI